MEIVCQSSGGVDICSKCTFSCREIHKAAHDLEELVWLSSMYLHFETCKAADYDLEEPFWLSSMYLQFETYKAAKCLEEIVWLSPEAAIICPQCTFSCFETQKAAHDLEELVCLSSGGAVICPQLSSVAVRPTRSLMILRSRSGCPRCTFSLRPARPHIILSSLSGCPLEGWTSVLSVLSVALGPTRPLVILCRQVALPTSQSFFLKSLE